MDRTYLVEDLRNLSLDELSRLREQSSLLRNRCNRLLLFDIQFNHVMLGLFEQVISLDGLGVSLHQAMVLGCTDVSIETVL